MRTTAQSSRSSRNNNTPGYAATTTFKLKQLTSAQVYSLSKDVEQAKLLNFSSSKSNRKNTKNSKGATLRRQHQNQTSSAATLDDSEKAHEIDFVATQLTKSSQARHPLSNLLVEKSMEIQPTHEGMLSARGITHRPYQYFVNQIVLSSNQIRYSDSSEGRTISLGNVYFNRGYAYEVCNNTERAIRDYSTCIDIFKAHKHHCVAAYFNRSLLHYGNGDTESALNDLNAAISFDTKMSTEGLKNPNLYKNRALLRRKMNRYLESWSDIKVVRKIEDQMAAEKKKLASLVPPKLSDSAAVRATMKTLRLANSVQPLSPVREIDPRGNVTNNLFEDGQTAGDTHNNSNSPDTNRNKHNNTQNGNHTHKYSAPNMNVLVGGSSNSFGVASTSALTEETVKDSVVQILEKEPKDRSKLEAEKVASSIVHFDFFSLMEDDLDALVHLCKKVELRTYKKDTYIFHKGDLGDVFYVLYEGAVSITIHLAGTTKSQEFSGGSGSGSGSVSSSKSNDSGGLSEKTLKLLHKGDTFGETALKTVGGRRGANAKCTQDSLLLIITCDDFLAIEEEHEVFLRQQKLAMVRRCPAFHEFNTDQLEKIVKRMEIKRYDAKTAITHRGDSSTELCLIKKGMVKVMKETPLKLCFLKDEKKKKKLAASKNNKKSISFKSNSTYASPASNISNANANANTSRRHPPKPKKEFLRNDAPGIWVIQRNWRDIMEKKKPITFSGRQDDEGGHENEHEHEHAEEGNVHSEGTHNFTVGVLGSGQFFGELSVLDPTEYSPVSVVSCTNVELYTLGQNEIKKLGLHLNHHMKQSLEESIVMHNPPGEKVAHFFRNKVNWELQKGEILESCLSEKWLEAKKNGDKKKTTRIL